MDSDLIAGVMSAADPGRLSRARTRLSELGAVPSGDGFVTKMKQLASAEKVGAPPLGLEAAAPAGEREKVLRQFESTLLASTLGSIMPKSQDSLMGGGPAEEIWKGQQVQFISQAIAERSPLGLLGMFSDTPRETRVAGDAGAAVEGRERGHIRPFAYSPAIEGQT